MYEFERVVNYPWEFRVLSYGMEIATIIQHSKYGITLHIYDDAKLVDGEEHDIERAFFEQVIKKEDM